MLLGLLNSAYFDRWLREIEMNTKIKLCCKFLSAWHSNARCLLSYRYGRCLLSCRTLATIGLVKSIRFTVYKDRLERSTYFHFAVQIKDRCHQNTSQETLFKKKTKHDHYLLKKWLVIVIQPGLRFSLPFLPIRAALRPIVNFVLNCLDLPAVAIRPVAPTLCGIFWPPQWIHSADVAGRFLLQPGS